MGESRQELVSWVNDLLLTDITKVEQCGTGAIFCQIFDSIYLDVPMSKVRFDVNSEYQYLNNFKVLQSMFTRHKVDRVIPVERLVKCRFQDNLEFLQWMRRYWGANYPGHEYDPISRRKGVSVPGAGSRPAPARAASRTSSGISSTVKNINSPAKRLNTTTSTTTTTTTNNNNNVKRPPSVQQRTSLANGRTSTVQSNAALTAAKEKIGVLESENAELINAVDLVESEREFYFQKLRDIEVLIQTAADELDQNNDNDNEDQLNEKVETLNLDDKQSKHAQLVREIQAILYSTAEGFEIPTQEYETEETF